MHIRSPVRLAIGCFVLGITSTHAVAGIVHVKHDAAGNNNGTSWVDAYSNLQDALVHAQPGDEIWVAAGTYTPAPPGDSVTSFELRSGVAIYGGFNGTEGTTAERDWVGNPTVLSGDVGFDDVPGNFNSANSGHVVVGSGVDASARLDGFTIQAGAYGPPGTPAGNPLLYGSGLYVVSGSPTIANCRFAGNFAAFGPGGAAYLWDSNSTFSHCEFDANRVHLGSGGGMYIGGASQPTIADCLFANNIVTAVNGQEGQGGGIQNASTLPLTITRCVFDHNQAQPFSAGIYEIPRGGGISSFALSSAITVRECEFRNNTAPYGGGMFCWNTATLINCTFHHNTASTYAGSGGVTQGGQGAGYMAQWSDSTLINCSIAHNTGREAVGVRVIDSPTLGGSALVHNCVIWGNVANGEDVSPRDAGIKGAYEAAYSCIQDLLTTIPGEDPPDPRNYPGCHMLNPLFVNATNGDLHLSANSPCIDAGQNEFMPAEVTTDLAGLPRFVDDPMAPDAGGGTPPLIDMGAFERQLPSIVGDLNGDGTVNVADLLLVIAHWGMCSTPPTGCAGDANADGQVNVSDLLLVIAHWG